jgi:hypothetical protein
VEERGNLRMKFPAYKRLASTFNNLDAVKKFVSIELPGRGFTQILGISFENVTFAI